MKNEDKEKREKEKALGAYNTQYKQKCQKCGKYGRKLGDHKCPKNKTKTVKNDYKNKNSTGCAIIVDKVGVEFLNERTKMAIKRKMIRQRKQGG